MKPTCPKCSAPIANARVRTCAACGYRWRVVGGTLKCEIVACDWDLVAPRLRALRDTCAQALTLTMRDLYPDAVDALKGAWDGEKFVRAWEASGEKRLREHWNAALARRSVFVAEMKAKAKEKGPEKGPQQEPQEPQEPQKEPQDQQAHAPVTEYFTAETVDQILSRFAGEHLKDLLAGRASFPSWRRGCAFYVRSRACEVLGPVREARLLFPLWGAGRKATELRVAPCGREGEIAWRRLVDGVRDGQGLKMGRVGITHDERRRKWYVLVTWTETIEHKERAGQAAALNLGCNQFVVAVAEDGSVFRVDGTDILAKRRQWNARRASIQRNLATMGSGSKGRGVKRRMAPIARLDDAERRWMESKNRQIAASLRRWCIVHGVARLVREDLSGIRDAFDRKNPDAEKSEAGLVVKRMIHSWPFFEFGQAVDRSLLKADVVVDVRVPDRTSQRCSACGHVSPENVQRVDGRVETRTIEGKTWERRERVTKFCCVKCGVTRDGDENAAQNHLLDALGTSCKEDSIQRSKRGRRRKPETLPSPG